jgi:translocation and assembly module TamB
MAGALLDGPVTLSVSGEQRDGATRLTIDRSSWKSLSVDGDLTLPTGATLPIGQLNLRMAQIDDLAPLLGRPVGGAISAAVTGEASAARARVTADRLTLPGLVTVGEAILDASVANPGSANPSLDARLTLRDGRMASVALAGSLTATGPADALVLRLAADRLQIGDEPATLTAAAVLRTGAATLDLTALRAGWRGQSITLLAPARMGFGGDTTIDRLRLGLGKAELIAAGRAGETLDLSVTLNDLPLELLSLVDPSLRATGAIGATLRLTGAPAAPDGSLRLRGTGLRLRDGPASALPAAALAVDATLRGGKAQTEARATLGASGLTVTGLIPLGGATPLDLRARGNFDLALTDPILTTDGRRARGTVTVDVGVTGPMTAPRTRGTILLRDGDFQDAALGMRLRGVTATVQADGEQFRLSELRGQTGTGTVQASGFLSLTNERPISLTLAADNARILGSDLATVTTDAALTLAGALGDAITLSGTVRPRRIDIRIPEHLPASVATIPVRVAGAPPAPAPAPAMPPIGLNLTLQTQGQVFVRGRGIDAELDGRMTLGGTMAAPHAGGGFGLRRGTFSVLGQVIGLSEGRIDFTGGALADPSLRLVASAKRASMTANAIISGNVKDPKISFTSVPPLPQDEVLSQLLFNTSKSRLSPFQIAQLANAIGALAGGPSLGNDPLQRLRDKVGLDRLTIGSDVAGRPVLEAGRYLADGVYVGTKQGASGGDTQTTIQIDLGAGIKLEATTGAGQTSATGSTDAANSSSVGITYQFPPA